MDDFDRSFYELMKKKYIIDRLANDFNRQRLELEDSLYQLGQLRNKGLIHGVEKSGNNNCIETETDKYVTSKECVGTEANYGVFCGDRDKHYSGFDDEITRSGYDSGGSVEFHSSPLTDNERTSDIENTGVYTDTGVVYDLENVSEDEASHSGEVDHETRVGPGSEYGYGGVSGENSECHVEDIDTDQYDLPEHCRSVSDQEREREGVYYEEDEETINYSERWVLGGTLMYEYVVEFGWWEEVARACRCIKRYQ